VNRHICIDEEITKSMLKVCGASSIKQLMEETIPKSLIDPNALKYENLSIPEPLSES